MATNQENTALLEEIYARVLKARDTYENAAKNAHNRLLTDLFERAANTHDTFAGELKHEFHDIGIEVNDKGASNLSADQFWLDFASIIVQRNEAAILKNCLKAEKKAIDLYDKALAHRELSDSLRRKLEAQRSYANELSAEMSNLEKEYNSD